MKPEKTQKNISAIAPLLLFVIFTTCILSVLLTGANTYKKLSQRDQESFQQRTVAQYLTTRLRQSDSTGAILVGDFLADPETLTGLSSSQGDTLILREEISGRIYYTRIYCHDGYLQELFSPAGIEFDHTAGDQILETSSLSFEKDGDLLSIHITYINGMTETLILHLRSGEEVSA